LADLQFLTLFDCKSGTLHIKAYEAKSVIIGVPQGVEVKIETITDKPPDPPPGGGTGGKI
jgi:hypothetical protein